MRRLAMILAGSLMGVSVLAADLPAGWIRAGSAPADYDMGIDSAIRHSGAGSGYLKAKEKADAKGFGTLMQTSDPGEYRGKRVRFSAYVKSDKVGEGWAGLWFRVDGDGRGNTLAFDNMQDRPIKGTTDWTRVVIVLDVPQAATAIAYGLLLSGSGQVWMDDLKFEVVGTDVPVTGSGIQRSMEKPKNLDFED